MRKAPALALAAAALAACSALDPYETSAPPVPAGRAEAGPRVAICYDGLASGAREVTAAAQAQCPTGTAATRVGTDWWMEHCPLLLPARAVFVCAPKK